MAIVFLRLLRRYAPRNDGTVAIRNEDPSIVVSRASTTTKQNLRQSAESAGNFSGIKYFILTTNADTHFQMNGFDKNKIFEAEGNFDGMEMQSPVWNAQYERFRKFISENADKNLLVMELGVGPRNQYLKSPIMNLLLQNPTWKYLAMNMEKDIVIPYELEERLLVLAGDIAGNLAKLCRGN